MKPRSLTFQQAGVLPSCALVAWSGIQEKGRVQAGQKVLVHGAAGGVGTLAVQLAKAAGALVIATASAHNHAFLKQLGADQVVDYRDDWGGAFRGQIDVVFNASPVREARTREQAVDALKNGGVFVCTQLDDPFRPDTLLALEKKGASATFVGGVAHRDALSAVATLVDAGAVQAIVSRVYPLDEVAQAHRECETRHVRGKIGLQIHSGD